MGSAVRPVLSLLRIRNFAVVEELAISFGGGLNVLTGETGAGKSIVLKSIELLSGRRASTDIIRTGTESCEIEGLFELGEDLRMRLCGDLEDCKDYLEEDELILRRQIDRSGKGRCYANGCLITLTQLGKLGTALLDITSQHEHQRLLQPAAQLALLDEFDVLPSLLTDTAATFSKFNEARKRLEEFSKNAKSQSEYIERITFERDELRQVGLEVGRKARAEDTLKRLANSEALARHVGTAIERIDAADEGLDDSLRKVSLETEQALSLDPGLSDIHKLIESAVVQLREARLQLGDYFERIEADPGELEELRTQVSEIARVERKYRRNESELVSYLEKIEAELAEYEGGEIDQLKLESRLEEAKAALKLVEGKLTAARNQAAKRLTKAVIQELATVNMRRALFSVALTVQESTAKGADGVEFCLAANPGEDAKPLSKVASGGELSRLLLILKTILNEKSLTTTQIFDEIDTGVSGAVAHAVGEKLKAVSKNSQVILVTHSPQIAALADHHFLLEKSVVKDKTTTISRRLSAEDRIDEIAKMLGGKKTSEKFHQSARELLSLKE